MAPIHNEDEWRELLAEGRALESGVQDGAGKPGNMWIGITKAAQFTSSDSGPTTGPGGSTSNWFNLDGTPVPDESVIWASGEPNNDPPGQTRAHLYFSNAAAYGKVRDLNPRGNRGPTVTAAIYKCCDDSVVTFTPTTCNVP